MKILTISIAAYNVEKYLEKTVSSMICEEILDDIEILIIDDGSKDGTEEIARKYQEKHPDSVFYIRKENGGHGSTINKGITLATGKYFKVIDGDDWVDTELFVEYIKKLKKMSADIILNSYVTVTPQKSIIVNPFQQLLPERLYSLYDRLEIGNITLHTLTIKTSLLKEAKVQITEKCYYVDIEYVIWAIYLSNTVCFVDLALYMYRIGNVNQSISKSNMLKNVEMQKTVSLKLVKLSDSFFKNDSIGQNKKRLILNRIKRSVGATERTYLLLKSTQETSRNIKSFEKEIRESSPMLYQLLGTGGFAHSIRMFHYNLIPLIRVLYRIWCRCKKYED